MTEQAQEQTIKVDNKVYKVSDLSEEAGSQVRALQIADQVVAQQQAQFEIARIGRDTIMGQLKESLKDVPSVEAPKSEEKVEG
tara:strand:- start:2338 stop:2586 length:249 start_codon:yes stop_codon:yes gene_type:complete